jgi:hypothetical protein
LGFRDWLNERLADFLQRSLKHYERRGWTDYDALTRSIRKGDVLLVDGDLRVSAFVKYLTQSSWSHATLYIGDELIRRGGAEREHALDEFGDDAHHLLVEALYEGVVVSPLRKYAESNVRLCRPHRLRNEHLQLILKSALSAVGWRYDARNVLDLACHLILLSMFPGRYRRRIERLGSGVATEVICTSLLGGLFHKVGFPVLPSVTFPEPAAVVGAPQRFSRALFRRHSHAGVFRQRHHTLLTPRDFDLSPHFEIVKFNVIGQAGFDYQQIEWHEAS